MSTEVTSHISALDGLISRSQLAAQLDVHERTVMRWEGEGLPVIRVGKMRLHDPAAVRGWIVSHQSREEAPRGRGRPRKAA